MRTLYVTQASHQMTSLNRNIFCVDGHLCGKFTGPRWIPRTKASDAELSCFLWSASEKTIESKSCGWWFGTPSRPLWRRCNDTYTDGYHIQSLAYIFGNLLIRLLENNKRKFPSNVSYHENPVSYYYWACDTVSCVYIYIYMHLYMCVYIWIYIYIYICLSLLGEDQHAPQ